MSTSAVGMSALLVVTAILFDASVASAQGWQLAEPMPRPRTYHAGATIGDRWYIAGGNSWIIVGEGESSPAQVDVYDPTSGHWTALGTLGHGRHTFPAIADPRRARILFPGGGGPSGLAAATCDIAGLEGVVSAPSLLGARYLHAAALAAGKFVVTGGWGMEGRLLDDAESWDGTFATWMAAGSMPGGQRYWHTMTTLQNGREILVVGGRRPDRALGEVDLFDAACGSWSRTAPLSVPRAGHEALLLNDDRVLVAGGFTGPSSANNVLTSAELFDPATREWKLAGSMTDPRFDFDMVLLPDGRVLVAGGSNNAPDGGYGALSSAEVYDPVANTWTPLPPMRDRRRWPTLAALSDGVYVAGGNFSSSMGGFGGPDVLSSVERLPWSELGISGPGNVDAGLPDETPPEASTVCPSEDAGMGGDTASDAGAGGDKSGCSCNVGDVRDNSLACLALAFVVCPALRRRARRHYPRETSSAAVRTRSARPTRRTQPGRPPPRFRVSGGEPRRPPERSDGTSTHS